MISRTSTSKPSNSLFSFRNATGGKPSADAPTKTPDAMIRSRVSPAKAVPDANAAAPKVTPTIIILMSCSPKSPAT